jgi:hypothetical protein
MLYNTFANFIKRPQATSLGLHKQSPPPWTEILVGCGGSLCSYSDTADRVLDFGEGIVVGIFFLCSGH